MTPDADPTQIHLDARLGGKEELKETDAYLAARQDAVGEHDAAVAEREAKKLELTRGLGAEAMNDVNDSDYDPDVEDPFGEQETPGEQ
jgi:hypothetical protein